MAVRAVVIGAGWSGEGHTRALQYAGVKVAALCGRSLEPARAMAKKLGIQDLRFDWRQAIVDLKPDIVSIATPGVAHAEMVTFAAQQGCHIVCEKPLGLNGEEALNMLRAVESAGVKHAICDTLRFAPASVYACKLLAENVIGEVREVEALHHFNMPSLMSYSWFHRLDQGGGALFQDFAAFYGLILHLTGGTLQAVAGEARRLIDRVPDAGPIHDLRDTFIPLDPDVARKLPWKEVDADMGYTVMARLKMPSGNPASVLFQGSEMAVERFTNGITLYGDQGILRMPGYFFPEGVELYDPRRKSWMEMSIPEDIHAEMSIVEDPPQNAWCHLFKAFVADVREEPHAGYPTFLEGWQTNEVIDVVRGGLSWKQVPHSY